MNNQDLFNSFSREYKTRTTVKRITYALWISGAFMAVYLFFNVI